MWLTLSLVDGWLSRANEDDRLEFKEAKSQFDWSRLCEYCVALANEGGGHLVFGVTDSLPRRVVGSNAFRGRKTLANDLLKALGFRVDVAEMMHSDGRIVVFRVPERPRGIPLAFEGKYLMRAGESLVPMSSDRLRAIIGEGEGEWTAEVAVSGATPDDVIRLLDTQSYFDMLGRPYPSDRSGVLDRLRKAGFVSARGSRYDITNLGAILFAKRLEE